MLTYILFAIGFVLLIAGANYLVKGASSLARRFGVSDLVIGLTLVAFGTSTPELVVNIYASLQGTGGIALGNIMGSNIFNVLLILGIAAVIYPLKIETNTVRKETPLSLLAAVVVVILANDALIDGNSISQLTRIDGLILLIFFAFFLYYAFGIARQGPVGVDSEASGRPTLLLASLMVIGGLAALTFGAQWVVDGAIAIAENLGVSDEIIGLTVVAAGTSLPELATSTAAALRHNSGIAVGNIVGSNIFNIFFILGVSAAINPLTLGPQSNLSILAVIISSLVLLGFMLRGKPEHFLDRKEGIAFLALYAGYLAYLIIQA
jgi:cation:H+ antiporter